jgi:hypothetical protein
MNPSTKDEITANLYEVNRTIKGKNRLGRNAIPSSPRAMPV